MSVARTAKLNKAYNVMIREFPLRPIRNDEELAKATEIVCRLAVYDEGTLPPAKQDYLDTLSVLIEDYERDHYPELDDVTPREMLTHLMEEREMNISDLGRLIGSQSNASLILSGKREISKRVIQVLSKHFNVDPGVFIQAPKPETIELAKSRNYKGDGSVKIELNDDECYIAATALHVQARELEDGIEDEPDMENRHWRLEKIKECRSVMEKIDKAWDERYRMVYSKKKSDRFVGIAKGPALRRRINFNFEEWELQALTWCVEAQDTGARNASAKAGRAFAKRINALLENGNEK